jgi:hypothetical protein
MTFMLLSPSFGDIVARWRGLSLPLRCQNLPPRLVLPTKIDLHSHFPPKNKSVDNVQDAAVDVDLLADVDVVLAVNNVQDLLYDLRTDILPILLKSIEEI